MTEWLVDWFIDRPDNRGDSDLDRRSWTWHSVGTLGRIRHAGARLWIKVCSIPYETTHLIDVAVIHVTNKVCDVYPRFVGAAAAILICIPIHVGQPSWNLPVDSSQPYIEYLRNTMSELFECARNDWTWRSLWQTTSISNSFLCYPQYCASCSDKPWDRFDDELECFLGHIFFQLHQSWARNSVPVGGIPHDTKKPHLPVLLKKDHAARYDYFPARSCNSYLFTFLLVRLFSMHSLALSN